MSSLRCLLTLTVFIAAAAAVAESVPEDHRAIGAKGGAAPQEGGRAAAAPQAEIPLDGEIAKSLFDTLSAPTYTLGGDFFTKASLVTCAKRTDGVRCRETEVVLGPSGKTEPVVEAGDLEISQAAATALLKELSKGKDAPKKRPDDATVLVEASGRVNCHYEFPFQPPQFKPASARDKGNAWVNTEKADPKNFFCRVR